MDRLFALAAEFKSRSQKGIIDHHLSGKVLGLIFDKPSTRTRISFEAAMMQLGGSTVFLNKNDLQLTRHEPIRDTARVISRYIHVLAIRTFSQKMLEEFALNASIPIINALTDSYHPCQILSDILTIIEHRQTYEHLNIVWLGDGNNVAHSWINASAILGFNLVLCCPQGFSPDTEILNNARQLGGRITESSEPYEAVKSADVIYTDVWVSMGQKEQESQKTLFQPYQINKQLLAHAPKDAMVMHCLPAHRGEEITDEVLEGNQSVVWDQAENKLHLHKALLVELLLNRNSI